MSAMDQTGEAAATSVQTNSSGDAKWFAFAGKEGPRWNGDASSWPSFKEWFLYEAGQQGVGEPAAKLIDYTTSQPDMFAAFTGYVQAAWAAVSSAAPESDYQILHGSGIGNAGDTNALSSDEFPLLTKLFEMRETPEGLALLVFDETGVDLPAIVREVDDVFGLEGAEVSQL